ncbi:MAG: CHRD domain-containing protein [Actinomycetota bacterium]|nr:CHRD domain-containing protein [Actinomycetota bacterium]
MFVFVFPSPVAQAGTAGYGYFSVQLTGHEVPGGGDPTGQGLARLDLDPEHELACFVIPWRKLDGAVTDLRLYAAPRGREGPQWIDFFADQQFPGAENTVSGCVHVSGSHGMSSQDKIQTVIHDPSGFYLNMHSTEFPKGAIRGQLG